MKLQIRSPTKAFLDCTDEELALLRKALTYTNTGVQHLIKRHYQNHFWKARNFDSWQIHLDNLKKQLKNCLIFEEHNNFYVRPGSIPYLTGFDIQVENLVNYPTPK